MKLRQWFVSLGMLVFGAVWVWVPMPYVEDHVFLALGLFWGSFVLLVFLLALAARPWQEGTAPDRSWNGVLAEATGPVGIAVFLGGFGFTSLVVAEVTGLIRVLEQMQ